VVPAFVIKISKDPRCGLPSVLNVSAKCLSGINLLNSAKTSLALRLNTDQDVQWLIEMTWLSDFEDVGDASSNFGFAFFDAFGAGSAAVSAGAGRLRRFGAIRNN